MTLTITYYLQKISAKKDAPILCMDRKNAKHFKSFYEAKDVLWNHFRSSEDLRLFKVVGRCPKCHHEFSGYPSLSRNDNKTEICYECKVREALEVFRNAQVKN